MDYIKGLRRPVGSRPLAMAGAALFALNRDNKPLMVKQTDNNCRGIPDGTMEPGEGFEDTVSRENREEIGIEVGGLEPFGVYSGKERYYKYPNGDEVYNVSVVYLTYNIRGFIQIDSEKHGEYHFF